MLLSQFPELSEFKKLAKQFNVIPVCVEILADTETPVSLLRKIYHSNKPAFLFESVEGGERWGRYSFLSTSVRSHVRVTAGEVEIEQDGQKQQIPHGGNPLSVLRMLMSRSGGDWWGI
jgi:anthranilate synthase component 1